MTVCKCWFISSGEMTRHERVSESQSPGPDPESQARARLVVAGALPPPFLAIKVGRARALQQKLVGIARACGPKRFSPIMPGTMCRRNNQTAIVDSQLDRVAQPALLDERLGNADATGVADTNQFRFHIGNYVVITQFMFLQVGFLVQTTKPKLVAWASLFEN